jgi:hypothetical protein
MRNALDDPGDIIGVEYPDARVEFHAGFLSRKIGVNPLSCVSTSPIVSGMKMQNSWLTAIPRSGEKKHALPWGVNTLFLVTSLKFLPC